MNITNFNSDLTPKQDQAHGCGKSKFGVLLSKKVKEEREDYRRSMNGIRVHHANIHNDYVSIYSMFL